MDKLFFDIETTGADSSKDRIVQLAIKVIDEEGNVIVNKSKLYNPGIPISAEATAIHGIKASDVKNCPPFKEDAKKLKKLFENKIIIMYNGLRFDIPILMNEFDRAGVEVVLSGKFIDVLKIERKLSPHTLSATYKKYTGLDLDGAHNAEADVDATDIVMTAQKERNSLSDDDLIEITDTGGMADYYGKLKYDDKGFLVFNWGKCRGKRVVDEPSYASWVLSENFPSQVKKLIREEQTKGLKARPEPQTKKSTPILTTKRGDPEASKPSFGGFRPVPIQTNLGLSEDFEIDDLPF